MSSPQESRFKHRDLNWLSFNERVLQEAEDKINPLYERIKFLAIFAANLDEFFRVRVSQLRQIKRVDKNLRKKLALRPNKITKQILRKVKLQQKKFGEIYRLQIIPELASNNIHVIPCENYDAVHMDFIDCFFENNVREDIKPDLISLPAINPVFLENNRLYYAVSLKDLSKFGLVEIPISTCGRFIPINKKEITYLDDIVKTKIPELFPGEEITGIYEIKLSRDAELYIDDEYEGILAEKIYESLEQREEGQPTRLLYDSSMPKEFQKVLRKLLNLGKIDMMPGGRYHNFTDFFDFPDPSHNKDLQPKVLRPVKHRILEKSKDYFHEISLKDHALHFPYMSFNYVERFLEQAANDPGVTSIKISIYRMADESPLTNSLLKALRNGKKVTVFIEAKARFDEENNILWGRKFEKKGARVIYSYPKIKVHSKILLVERLLMEEKKNYAFIGTGNFNSKTASVYCDHGIFTANKQITKELSRLFNVLEGDLIIPREKFLLISPFSSRKKFLSLIMTEINNARAGKKAKITAKMNSLEDKEIIEWLYKASNAGVEIRLLVRGFTCLIPGVKGLSENIYITSIVDSYLEHGRIYLFENDGDEKMFFGSADWMTRNLDRRIEVIAPVNDKEIFAEFKHILHLQLNDNVKARIQDEKETNNYVKRKPNENIIRSQRVIYDYLKKTHEG